MMLQFYLREWTDLGIINATNFRQNRSRGLPVLHCLAAVMLIDLLVVFCCYNDEMLVVFCCADDDILLCCVAMTTRC